MLQPIVTAILPMLLGDLIFSGGFCAEVTGRVDGMLKLDSLPLPVSLVVILAFGEEIA